VAPLEDSLPAIYAKPEKDVIIFLLGSLMKALAGVAMFLNPASMSVVYLTPCLLGFGFATPP
jgi:hypothetical protein